jgi:Icc-related predicted phosphoesterase
MRVFAVSDLHVNHDSNAQWVEALSGQDYNTHDTLILAGDLSDSLSQIEEYLNKTGQFSDNANSIYFWLSKRRRTLTASRGQIRIRSFAMSNRIVKHCQTKRFEKSARFLKRR